MRRTNLRPLVALLLACASLCAGPLPSARAQDAYSCIDRLSDAEVRHRLAFLERSFETGKRRARMFWYGWGAFGVGAVAFTWTLYGLRRDEGRDDSDPALINAFGSVLLLGQTAILPLWPAFAPQRLARLPERTPEERRAKLRRATRYLERSADRVELLRGIPSHLGAVAFAVGGGTYVAARYDEPLASAQAFIAPIVIAETKILSVPTHAYYDWERYRSFACQVPAAPPSPEDLDLGALEPEEEEPIAWSLVPAPGGLGLRLEF